MAGLRARKPEQRQAGVRSSVRRALERFTGPLTAEQREHDPRARGKLAALHASGATIAGVWREALAEALARRDTGAAFERRCSS